MTDSYEDIEPHLNRGQLVVPAPGCGRVLLTQAINCENCLGYVWEGTYGDTLSETPIKICHETKEVCKAVRFKK